MQLNFNASTVAPSTAPEPVETGTYAVLISGAREVPTKDKQNSFLELKLEIKTGPMMGRVIIDRLNLKHGNPQTQEIAYGQLSAICHVTGRMQLQNSQQLVGAMMQVYVVKEPRNDSPGQYSNSVKGYKDMNGNEPGQGGQHGGAGQMATQQNFDPNAGQVQNNFQQPNTHQQGQVQNNGGWDANQQGGNMQGQNFNQQPNQQQNFQQPNNGQNFNQQPNPQGQNFQPQGQVQNNGQNFQQPNGGQQMQQNNGYQQPNPNQNGGGNYQPNTGVGGPAGGGQAPDWA